ncbi:MAG TPA: DUF4249 domain-containing protein [Flavobacterium sp.]|nr:DUF4249 domain-containing protein [Flavobacterium sp.]
MVKFYFHRIVLLLLVFVMMTGCTEQYMLHTNTFDDALVVEATITNELKKQEIKLTHTFRFEQTAPQVETSANVFVTDSDGQQYDFEEISGKYISTAEFQAIPGKTYRLNITTQDGRTYNSSGETLAAVNEMQSVVPAVETKNGQRGISIIVNSFDPAGASKYYRYEYEETYKIIAPKWDDNMLIMAPAPEVGQPDVITLVPRTSGETRTCYKTVNATDILLTSTIGLIEDRVKFSARFLSIQDPIIAHRYSILVRQYVQNLASYAFYTTLKNLSGSGSILSQNQPGFFYGNMKSVSNPNEKVIGFFDVASVSSKRVFFNFIDLFPHDPLPPYFQDCESKIYGDCLIETDPNCRGNELRSVIRNKFMLYFADIFYAEGGYQIYYMVEPPCGDCTKLSSNVIPSFWID